MHGKWTAVGKRGKGRKSGSAARANPSHARNLSEKLAQVAQENDAFGRCSSAQQTEMVAKLIAMLTKRAEAIQSSAFLASLASSLASFLGKFLSTSSFSTRYSY